MSLTWVKSAIPRPMRRQLGPLRRLASDMHARPGFALSRMPLFGEAIAAAARVQCPPILVVSLPRGGSSWIGRILGSSEDALYLREPITQSYVEEIGKGTLPVFELGMCKALRSYERFASRAFSGIPRFSGDIVQSPSQWTVLGRSGKRVVIKEVNPLAVERWWEMSRPRIVFLVRHPVAVMRSYQAKNWTGHSFWESFTDETLAALEAAQAIPKTGSRWEQGGAYQAVVQNLTMAFLDQVDHAVVRYEDVCSDPLGEFARIFDYCGLRLSAAVEADIARSSEHEGDYEPGRYDTVRNSREMNDRWKSEVEADSIAQVRRGYLAMKPRFYVDDSDW